METYAGYGGFMIVEIANFGDYSNLMEFYHMDIKRDDDNQLLVTPKFVVIDDEGPYFFLYKCHEKFITFDEWQLLMHVCSK